MNKNQNNTILIKTCHWCKHFKSISFLSTFWTYGLTITEKSPVFCILPLPVFLYLLPVFLPCFYILFLFWPIHLVLDLHGRFPSIFVYHFLRYPLIHITCPNHLNLLFSMSFFISSTPSPNLMLVFITCPSLLCLKFSKI